MTRHRTRRAGCGANRSPSAGSLRRTTVMAALACLAMLEDAANAATTYAFSEPLLYPEPTVAGGGGGRFFTGSSLDGFSCTVCHEGAAPPTVSLRGFPEFFEPGKKYEVELSWTEPAKPHALNLEIIDQEGKAAGTIRLPDEADVDDEGRCTLSEDEATRDQVAASLSELGERRIISVLGCGSRSLKFTFEAPEARRIALTAGVVRSNQKEDTSGDGVLELRRFSRREGAVGTPVSSGCSTSTPSLCWSTLAVLLVAALRRRRLGR